MSATNQFEDDLLDLLLTNVAAPNIGDAGGLLPSAAAGSVQISLHTAALADTDTLTTANEVAYTNYARQTVARSVAGWTVAAGIVDNDSAIVFPQCGATGATVTDFGMTMMATGNYLGIFGVLTSSLAISNGVTPSFAAGALDITIN